MFILNAFSLNMIVGNADISVREVSRAMAACLASGCISAVGHADTAAIFSSVLGVTEKGVWFDWDWEVEIDRPRFDGAVRKFAGGWLISFAEIDRMGYSLDEVLQLIHDNVMDGVVNV